MSRQTINAYAVLLLGAALFLARRLVLPTTFELEALPFDIAVPSVLNSCYRNPALSTCSDGVIVVLTVVGVTIAAGWGGVGRMIFAAILALMPLGLYLMLSPIWIPLALLMLLPVAIDTARRLLFPSPG